jgi:hypothetical protein
MDATTTAPARQRKPRPKPARFVCLRARPQGLSAGLVRIRVGDESADYSLTELAADFGRGFQLHKFGGDDAEQTAYQVNLDGANRTCDCKGFCRWSRCKHADGLAALIAAGWL